MTYKTTVYRVLISSPSDLEKERKEISEVVLSWNTTHSQRLKVVLLPVMWETHTTPDVGDSPQDIINRQIVGKCDILVGAFWTRIGTETSSAASGTVEEINEFIASGKPVMLYFSSKPVNLSAVDTKQLDRLRAFKDACSKKMLYQDFNSMDDLREKLHRHLTDKIQEMTLIAAPSEATQPDNLTAATFRNTNSLSENGDLSLDTEEANTHIVETSKSVLTSFLTSWQFVLIVLTIILITMSITVALTTIIR